MIARPFSAIILAGGYSSRMGSDKAQLLWQGIPLWQHQQQLLQSVGCEDILLSHPQLGIADLHPGLGPLSGLQTLLPRCRHTTVLIIPVDMPLLNSATLHTLLHGGQHTPVYFRESVLPCVLHRNDPLADYLQQNTQPHGQRSIGALLRHCQATAIDCPEPDALMNTNTPAEWQTACLIEHESSQ